MNATPLKHLGSYRVEARGVRHVDRVLADEIDALARVAIEPNVFHESWMLAPALAHLGAAELLLVAVRDGSGTLSGLFPLHLERRYHGVPLRCLRSWQHDYLFLGSPLVAADGAERTIGALLDWCASGDAPAGVLELLDVRADGPLAAAITAASHARGCAMRVAKSERALLDLRAPSRSGVSGKHKKELRRLERRLGDLGRLDYSDLAAGEDAEPWLERFLALEAAGWKGRGGTALAARSGGRAFFLAAAREASRRGRLQMLEMRLDGAAIAAKCNFIGGEGVFMFKIAYDERYAKYSPGVLLELFGMGVLQAGATRFAWADSCARPEHFMAERLWSDRRALGDYSICARGRVARALITHADRLRDLKRYVTASART
ncbi:MAG: GNAT family N-acetyltransferase [Labilithrix sp.]|nr:GNAT family N-acetyltransferase [Labilithrix sp.]MBX3221355.1 GNAT family N-acetyltransferase [Labilithrix sp.]